MLSNSPIDNTLSFTKESVWTAIVAITVPRRVLLLRRGLKAKNPGKWNFPGGGLDLGKETRILAAVRELREETGVAVPSPALIFLDQFITGPKQHTGYLTFCDQTFAPILNEEHDHALWLERDDLAGMIDDLHTPTRRFIETHFFPGDAIWESSTADSPMTEGRS